MHTPSITFSDASFAWPDGAPVLDHVTAAFGPGRTGLVGDNGAGKTTLMRLIRGELAPTGGRIATRGEVGYLPQHLTLDVETTVAELLGIAPQVEALRAIEAGAVDPELFDTIGSDWDVEARAAVELAAIGLDQVGLDRRVGTLSGGEAMLVALAGLRLAATPIVLLDEPTNNLDLEARQRLYAVIDAWRGALVVVSHDVELLDRMDETAELRGAKLPVFGGGYTAFAEAVEQEQQAALQALRTAEQTLKLEQRQRREAEIKLARRKRYADTDHANKRRPKIIMNLRRSEAQVSAGKLRDSLDDRVDAAREAVEEQEARVRVDERVRITLPDPGVGADRRLAELHGVNGAGHDGVHTVAGPERVALSGPNGSGKTRLLSTLFDPELRAQLAAHAVPLTSRIGYLPQRIDGLDETQSALDAVRSAAPSTPPGEVRAQLARFLLRGDDVERRVGALSGGERFRVAVARLLLADPAHQLLVFDEPTNNLDLRTTRALIDALADYRGALVVVSHDRRFLDELGITTWLSLEARCSADGGHLRALGS